MPATTADGPLGARGLRSGIGWTTSATARARAAELLAIHRGERREIVRNPHSDTAWTKAAVRALLLLAAVQGLIGPDVAVENTFLVVKPPGRAFEVPWHSNTNWPSGDSTC